MIAIRVASAVLAGVSLIALSACGSESEPVAPAATTATASAAATSAAAESAATAESTTAAVAGARNADTVTCEQASKAVDSFKNAVIALAQSGATEISPTDAKAMLTDLATQLTKASEGASPEMAAALKATVDEALKASKAADPANAIDTPESAKASKDLNALCKQAGVNTTF